MNNRYGPPSSTSLLLEWWPQMAGDLLEATWMPGKYSVKTEPREEVFSGLSLTTASNKRPMATGSLGRSLSRLIQWTENITGLHRGYCVCEKYGFDNNRSYTANSSLDDHVSMYRELFSAAAAKEEFHGISCEPDGFIFMTPASS